MSDINISGIPNMGFQGGGGGYFADPAANLAQNQQQAAYYNALAAQRQQQMMAEGQYFNDWSRATNANMQNNINATIASNLAIGKAAKPGTYAGNRIANPTPIGPPAPQQQPDPWAGSGFDPIQYLYDNPDVMRNVTGDPSSFAYQHATTHGIGEGRVGASVFETGAAAVPYLKGRGGVGGGLSPLNSYQGSGYNAFDPSSYSSASQPNLGWKQPQASVPFQDFNVMEPDPAFRPNQGKYDDWFNDQTAPARGSQGGWEQSYYEQNPDVWKAAIESGRGLNAFAQEHANQYGGPEGRQLFNAVEYLNNPLNADVKASGMGGWEHYNKFGRGEGRENALGNVFNPQSYLQNNQDVAAAGVDPRTHYLKYGSQEGRSGGGVVTGSRDTIARALMQGTPSGAVLGMTGPGGRDYGNWSPMTGGNATAQQLIDQGNAVNMPSGQFGGHPPKTFGAQSSGSLGVPLGSPYQDPFGGYVPSIAADGGLPANYAPRYDASPFVNMPGGG